MPDHTIVLIGGPDSGKTNYLARLWKALNSPNGMLNSPNLSSDLKYVEDALEHLLKGNFAPRTEKGVNEFDQNLSIPVTSAKNVESNSVQLLVPDVSGELWKEAVVTNELPLEWMDTLKKNTGALLFVRIGSDQNVDHLDCVTSARNLRAKLSEIEEGPDESEKVSTAVQLCELIRLLEFVLAKEASIEEPRVAILVTAWDLMDKQLAESSPMAYLEKQYPLLAGKLANLSGLKSKVFGVSIVGGDFVQKDFKKKFLKGNVSDFGYIVHECNGKVEKISDVTFPVEWVLGGQKNT